MCAKIMATKSSLSAKSPTALAESIIRVKFEPKLRNPLLIVGLPGIGYVGKLAADHVSRTLKAERFAKLISPHFPNQVIALKNGMLKPFTLRFYYKRLPKRDVVILRGDLQPLTVEGQYEVTAKILSFFSGLGGREVVAMAGYAANHRAEKPKIYCASTNKKMFNELVASGAKPTPAIIPIVGMAGLIPGLAPLYGMRGACLLAETPGTTIDALGAKAFVEMFSKILGEKMSVSDLEQRAKKVAGLLKQVEQRARVEEKRAREAEAGAMGKRETVGYV
jgi:hypothetical protein